MTSAGEESRLGRLALFEGIDPAAAFDLAMASELERVDEGHVVVREGDEGHAMYVIARGRVRVEKRTAYEDTYTVTFLDAAEGGFFGELALLDREHRSATVVAVTECELFVLTRERFLAFGDRHPTAGLMVTRRIAQNLAERLRRANRDLVTLFSALVDEIEETF